MNKVEGNKTESEVIKERGAVKSHQSQHDVSGKAGEHEFCGNLPQLGFKSGRTIELKRFEFCRVGLSIRVRIPKGQQHEAVREALETFVTEMVKREEAHVAGSDYNVDISDEVKDTISRCVCRCITVNYGLTLKSGIKEFESHQVDLMEELPVSDKADLTETWEALSEEMASYLDTQHKRIKGLDSDTGL